MARWLLAAVILCPLDNDPRRLIDRLGDEDPPVREAAMQALVALGNDALPLLRPAADHPDAEIRTRVSLLLRQIDQAAYFKSLALVQRPRKIRLMAAEVLPQPGTAVIDGGLFHFERRPWTVGSLIHTRLESNLKGEIEWSVAAVRAGEDLRVETCATHSPETVYLPEDGVAPYTVVIKGTRRWLCDVPLEFRDPAEGDQRRIGPYTLTLRWPNVEVQAEGKLPPTLIYSMIQDSVVRAQFRRGREQLPAEPRGPVTDEPAIFFPEAKEERAAAAWCGCELEPDRREKQPWLSWRRSIHIPADPSCGFPDLASVSLTFHLPIEEPFELESPPLK
ncbi:MAG: HEAT repeat domain-containing protein [Planctomycetes bacterium]|nr:HEAT repeat domain-containing protein [Planctomycetota bacterium]